MNELYKKLTKLQWLLHRRQMRGWVVRGPLADTTRGQGRILAVLKLRDGISTRDLSYLLGIRVSSLNELLMKMEKGGYVTREPSEQDKRIMLVKLTEKGRNEQQPKPFAFDDIFSCLSEDEQAAFGEYLDRIIDEIQANMSDDELHEKMDDIREKLGDIGAFFEEQGRDFFGWRGHSHGTRSGHRDDQHRHEDFRGNHHYTGREYEDHEDHADHGDHGEHGEHGEHRNHNEDNSDSHGNNHGWYNEE